MKFLSVQHNERLIHRYQIVGNDVMKHTCLGYVQREMIELTHGSGLFFTVAHRKIFFNKTGINPEPFMKPGHYCIHEFAIHYSLLIC